MSLKNRKILYDKLISEGKTKEADEVIKHHPEMRVIPKETDSKKKKEK